MSVEQEAKFYVDDLNHLQNRLNQIGARLVQAREYEHNQRYDDTAGGVLGQKILLRLRTTERQSTLTFKGPTAMQNGVNVRREIEFAASDPAAAGQFLEALGYRVCFIYEKYRTTYRVGTVQVMLDELPLGSFVEIEGGSGENIQAVADLLELDWAAHIPANYNDLFDHACQAMNLPFRDMTFENFQGLAVLPAALGVRPADVNGKKPETKNSG